MIKIKRRESNYAFIELREHYIYVRYKDLIVIDMDGVEEHAAIFEELCEGTKFPLVLDAADMDVKMTYNARIKSQKVRQKKSCSFVRLLLPPLPQQYYLQTI